MSSSGQQSIALVSDQVDGYFCCGFGTYFWNGTSCTSESTARGNHDAFALEPASFILNRMDGSTVQSEPSPSDASRVTVTKTGTVETYTVAGTAVISSDNSDKKAIAAGVGAGVPLACLLVVAVAFLIVARRRMKKLRDENTTQRQEIEDKKREVETAWLQNSSVFPHLSGAGSQPALTELSGDRAASELENTGPAKHIHR